MWKLNPLTVALLLGWLFCLPSEAAPWLSETFESYAVGSLAGQGAWNGDAEPVQVQDGFVPPGSAKSSAINCQWHDQTGGVSIPVSSGPGYHYLEFDAAMDTEGTAPIGQNIGYVMVFNDTGQELTRVYYSNKRFKVLTAPENQVVIVDNVVNDQWYHIRLGINLAAGTVDAWVGSEQKITAAPLYNPGNSIATITVGEWVYFCDMFTKSETYIDNLQGTQVTALPPGVGTVILSPRFFPGWQLENVCNPFVLKETADSYKMYYTGTGTGQLNESVSDQWMTGVVTSTDTLSWAFTQDYQPALYPHKYMEGEVVDSTTLSAEFDSLFAFGPCVIKDGSTYKMWYTGWNGDTNFSVMPCVKRNFRIGYATSTDGIRWTKVPGSAGAGAQYAGPAGQQDAMGVGQPYVIKEGSTYRMWYEGFDGTLWRIFYATSSNGTSWNRQGVALSPSGAGSRDELGARNPVVIQRNGGYELWYQGQSSYTPNYHVLRATSANGVTWTKQGEVTVHPPAPPRRWPTDPNWDMTSASAMVHVDSINVQADGSLQLFYAKQCTIFWPKRYGTTRERCYYIYTEVVNP